jgi:hypothetical protein
MGGPDPAGSAPAGSQGKDDFLVNDFSSGLVSCSSASSSGDGGLLGQAIDSVAKWITDGAANAATQLLGQLQDDAAKPDRTAPWFSAACYGSSPTSGPSQGWSTCSCCDCW